MGFYMLRLVDQDFCENFVLVFTIYYEKNNKLSTSLILNILNTEMR